MFLEFQHLLHTSTKRHTKLHFDSSSQIDMMQRVTSCTARYAGHMPAAVHVFILHKIKLSLLFTMRLSKCLFETVNTLDFS